MKLGDGVDYLIEVILFGFIVLDIVLGIGGYFRGRIIEVYGFELSGKIIFILYVMVSV